LWDLEDGRCTLTFTGHGGPVRSVAFSPDGRRALTASDDKTARLWDLENGRCTLTFTGHTDWVRSVAFSPDGRRALTTSHDRTARVWHLITGQETVRWVSDGALVAGVFLPHTQDRLLIADITGHIYPLLIRTP
jgi:WD40 repeat protein